LRRILGGSEITKAEYGGRYYYKALKVKRLIEEEFSKAFNGKMELMQLFYQLFLDCLIRLERKFL